MDKQLKDKAIQIWIYSSYLVESLCVSITEIEFISQDAKLFCTVFIHVLVDQILGIKQLS